MLFCAPWLLIDKFCMVSYHVGEREAVSMFKPKKDAAAKPRRMSGAALQSALSLVALLLGALLTFVRSVDVRVLCYMFCALLIAGGVGAIVYFFMTGAYKHLNDYNFALGVMLLILGCCGIARIGSLESSFKVCMGFLTLAIGIIVLQNTVQLRVVGSGLWVCPLIFTAAIIFGGISILVDFKAVWDLLHYWILIVSGAPGLIGLVVTAIVLRGNEKREGQAAEQPASVPEPEGEALPREQAPAPPETAPETTPAAPKPAEQDPFADLWPDNPLAKE